MKFKIKERLQQQIDFIIEIDQLKTIKRQARLIIDPERQENDAEHSWHLAILILVLAEYAEDQNVDYFKSIKMVLIHDLVEIDAGDTYAYDEKAGKTKQCRELKAANRIFSLLPEDQAREFHTLWDEFEANVTSEARFARFIDCMHPVLQNYFSGGDAWKSNNTTALQIKSRMQNVKSGSNLLWKLTNNYIQAAVNRGMIKEKQGIDDVA